MISQPSPARLVATLGVGMLAVSTGAILVRFSQEASPLVIAFYRVGWSSLLLAPFYLRSRARPGWNEQWGWQLTAGLGLGLHFLFWMASLSYTSVAVSILLTNTAPILVALAARPLFGERLTGRGLAGLALALAGGGVLVLSDLMQLGSVRGALLALAGAVALAVYLLAGRRLRQQLDLVGYAWRTYLLAAVLLGLLVLVSGQPVTGFSMSTQLFLFLVAAGPQCVGHTAYNWGLRFLPATLVAVLLLTEPLLAPLWAWWLLDEVPGIAVGAGAILLAAGLVAMSMGGVVSTRSESEE